MKNASLAVRASVLILSLFLLAGCKSTGSGEPASPADDVSPPIGDSDHNSGDSGPADDVVGDTGDLVRSAPSIWGDPEQSVMVGEFYLFQPEAEDGDGNVLEFSIVNKPDWASFDPATGALTGIPGGDDVGETSNIVISVTDQTSIASLPSFNLLVERLASPPDERDEQSSKSLPRISGTPNTSAVVGAPYSFVPEASDADGDDLSFSIVNKPAWASFGTTTGRLEGTPGAADIGRTDPIELSVTDGTGIAALAAFRIDVEQAGSRSISLSWTAPAENEDGSPLTDLAGYRIYYGTVPGEYPEKIVLDSPGVTSYVIEDLAPGRYYLVMTSFNSGDLESKYTPEMMADTDS